MIGPDLNSKEIDNLAKEMGGADEKGELGGEYGHHRHHGDSTGAGACRDTTPT